MIEIENLMVKGGQHSLFANNIFVLHWYPHRTTDKGHKNLPINNYMEDLCIYIYTQYSTSLYSFSIAFYQSSIMYMMFYCYNMFQILTYFVSLGLVLEDGSQQKLHNHVEVSEVGKYK